MRKAMVATLALALALTGSQAIAGKRKPKPYKSEQVTIAVPHPVFYGSTGAVNSITAKEFESSCALPSSNGLDAYVFEVPKAYRAIEANIEAIGTAASPASYDLDIYLYDADCKTTLAYNAAGTDEFGVIPKGTAYALVHNYLGEPMVGAQITLAPR